MAESDFHHKGVLGRTGFKVSRLGIGASYGVLEGACLDAFDQRGNYFFWGSVRTLSIRRAIRRIARKDRERLVVELESYVRFPGLLARSVENGLEALGLDHADILLLGWHDKPPFSPTARRR